MKKNKFLAALLAAGLLSAAGCFALVGCGGDGNTGDTDNGNKDDCTDIGDNDVPLGGDKCCHKQAEHFEAKDEDCTNNGNAEYWYCSDCRKYFTDEAFEHETTLAAVTKTAKGHEYGELHAAVTNKCQLGKKAYYYCEACETYFDGDKVETTENDLWIDPVHNLQHEEQSEPDCYGWYEEYWWCVDCERNFGDEYASRPLDDDLFDIWHGEPEDIVHVHLVPVNKVDETCTTDGVKAHWHCNDCETDFIGGEEVGEDDLKIPAKNHTLLPQPAKAPTCTEDGWDAYEACSDCDYDTKVVKSKLNHDMQPQPAKAPTCEEGGWDAYEACSRCDYDTKEDKPQLGHKYLGFEYNYETKQYEERCQNDETHTVHIQSAGVDGYPYLVKTVEELTAAIATGGYVKLEADINLTAALSITNTVNIDLNGKKITSAANAFELSATASVTVTGGDMESEAIAFNLIDSAALSVTDVNISGVNGIWSRSSGTVNVVGGEINTSSYAVLAGPTKLVYADKPDYVIDLNVAGTKVNVTGGVAFELHVVNATFENVNIDSYNTCILVFRDTTLSMENCTMKSKINCGIQGNGTIDKNNGSCGLGVTVTLDNCTVTDSVVAVYLPQTGGTTVINGGDYTGSRSAVEVRAGSLELNGAKLTCTSDEFKFVANKSGSTIYGAALAVSQHTTNDEIYVTVDGATLKGIYAIYEADVQDNLETNKITVEVNSLNEKSTGCVYSENCKLACEHEYAWVYDYETKKYIGTCKQSDGVSVTVAAGTEKFPYLVKDAETLTAAITNGGYVKLIDNITGFTVTAVSKDTIIDLNGKTITSTIDTQAIFVLAKDSGATLTVKNGTLYNYAKSYMVDNKKSDSYAIMIESSMSAENAPKLILENVTFNNNDTKTDNTTNYAASSGSKKCNALNLGNYAQVTAKSCAINGGYFGVNICSDNSVLTMDDCTLTDCVVAIQGNGNSKGTEITLKNSTVNTYFSIYHPQDGTLTVDNCEFETAGTCIEMRAGELKLTNSKLTCTYTVAGFVANTNGNSTQASAVGVSQHSTDLPIKVTISGTELHATYAIYEKDGMNETARDQISIELGEGNTYDGLIYSENCENVVNTGDDKGNALAENEVEAA